MTEVNSIIVVVGSSWVGKSSLTLQFAQRYNYLRISFGDLLREFIYEALLDRPSNSLTLPGLEEALLALLERRIIFDNQVHFLTDVPSKSMQDREFELVSVMAGLGSFFLFYEQAIIQLVKTCAEQSPIVVDGRDKAIELTLDVDLRPYFVLLTCPYEVRVRRYLSRLGISPTPEHVEQYLEKLQARERADLIHTPSLNIKDYVHLTLNTSELSIEQECNLAHSGAETYFAQMFNKGERNENSCGNEQC